jgi:flagellar hook protein FlgE
MSSIPALQSAVTGIMRGVNGLRNDAATVASANSLNSSDGTDLAMPLVDAIGNRQQVEASAKLIKAADAMLGSLIDIRA